MTTQLRFLLVLAIVWLVGVFIDTSLSRKQWVWAQDPGRGSRPEFGSRDDRGRDGGSRDGSSRDSGRYRGGFSDRFRRDRGGRSRDEERRGGDRSGSSTSGSGSTTSGSGSSSNAGSFTRSTTPSSSTSTASAVKPATDSASGSMAMTEYAKSLVKKYDRNGDMMLQPEERKELTGRAADSDLNHDGVITVGELVTHLSDSSPSSGSPSPTGNGSSTNSISLSGEGGHSRHHHDGDSNGGDHSRSDAAQALAGRVFTGSVSGSLTGSGPTVKEGDKRHSYRFTPGAERQPALPGELRSRDANGDGQVTMSEFSRNITASAIAEFRRWDLNDDGIITAKEAAKRR